MSTVARFLVSEREAMEALGIGRTLLRRLMTEGRIHGLHVGRRLVFHIEEIRRFADSLRDEEAGHDGT